MSATTARPLVQGERIWADPDRPVEDLGAPSTSTTSIPGTRVIDRSTVRFPEADLEITCTPLLPNYISIGTGYGIDADWRHGMYQGPDPVVQGLVLKVDEDQGTGPVRDRRPCGPSATATCGLRAPRARVLRSVPPLRIDRRRRRRTGRLTFPADACAA